MVLLAARRPPRGDRGRLVGGAELLEHLGLREGRPPAGPAARRGGEHDWTCLLEQLGLLEQDQAVGTAVRIAGTIIFVYAALRGYACARGSEGPTGTGPVSTA